MTSQTQNTKDGAGYTCDFVEQPPNLFICEICKLVLRYPQITQCCGRNACRPCIEKQAENGAPCPIPGCQNKCVEIIFIRDLHHDILKSRVYCSLRDNGCEWVDTLENLEKHLLECPFLEEECQNSCGMKIQRRMVKEHEAVCERFSVNCELCGNLYERRDQSSHLDACSLRTVKCPFSIVGCTTEVPNKDLQQHFGESLSEHYALVAKQSLDVQAEIRENSELFQEDENLKPLLAQSVDIREKIVTVEGEIAEIQSILEGVQVKFKELQHRHSLVTAEVQQCINEREASLHIIREEDDKLVFMSKVRCYGPALPFIHPANIVSRPLDCSVTTEEYIPRVSFMIPRFEEKKKKDAYLYLPPFFSHAGGYKMCLCVYCNGFSNIKESISIFVRILSGKYDGELEWPLHCKVEVEIKSEHKSRSNVKKTIKITSHSPTPRDRFVSENVGSCLHAIKLGTGYEPLSSYLTNGCLTIAVVRVQF